MSEAPNLPPADTASTKRTYDRDFQVTNAYRASLPDMQNRDASAILGADVPIAQVGMHRFCLPLTFATKSGQPQVLETAITGTVGLPQGRKGINMSRIMRVLYQHETEPMSPDAVAAILGEFQQQLDCTRAHLTLRFRYPIRQRSLRSGLSGWQYYPCAFEGILSDDGRVQRGLSFDFVYSSACPCSGDLAEHARDQRGVYSIPHSQRSKARVRLLLADGASLAIEDLAAACREALQTETQVMVKREDEQAFAELNGAYEKFVEDAARLLYQAFATDDRIADFEVACAHLESLHSHDAVAVIHKGVPGGFRGDFRDFESLIC